MQWGFHKSIDLHVVFAGSARLAQAVAKVALQAMAIDHTISKQLSSTL